MRKNAAVKGNIRIIAAARHAAVKLLAAVQTIVVVPIITTTMVMVDYLEVLEAVQL